MSTFNEKLKNARLAKGFKQADVAEILNCAPTSLTNWESGKVQPSLEVLSNICAIYEISPLRLLDREYTFNDILVITSKPVPDRTYEEQIALNFSRSILALLSDKDRIRQEARSNEAAAEFLQSTDIVNRFGGILNGAEIDTIRSEYEDNGKADGDILFAYHALTGEYKRTVLSILAGLFGQDDSVQRFNDKMDTAKAYTIMKLQKEKQRLK